MTLTLYNTMTRKAEPFAPRTPGKASVYCCGPTVYDVPHAGHARPAVVFDVLVRHLGRSGIDVTYVRNVTDIDDKILNRAAQNGETPTALSERMTLIYQQDMRSLGCLPPTHEPRVTEHVEQVLSLIETLLGNGSAYVLPREGGKNDVYFAVRSFNAYGKLSRRKIDDLQVGARIEEDTAKRDPLDFALWKGCAAEEWGWPSPWGPGRPGWHIECSAMCRHYLGHGIDIHAGGMDLIFPHHENEIAQSEAAHPQDGEMARVWMHNGFINIDKEKMSKSLGNFVSINDVLKRYDAEAFRWFLLGVHYRGPLSFDTEILADGRVVFPGVQEAERRMDYVMATVGRLRELAAEASQGDKKLPPELMKMQKDGTAAHKAAVAALDEDLNTSVTLAELGELVRAGNDLCDMALKRRKDAAFQLAAADTARALLEHVEDVAHRLGVLQCATDAYVERTQAQRLQVRGLNRADLDAKVAERDRARADKDFQRADVVRDELVQLGVTLKDSPQGTRWSLEAQ